MEFKVTVKNRVTGGKELVVTPLNPCNDIEKVHFSCNIVKTSTQLKEKLSRLFNIDIDDILLYQ